MIGQKIGRYRILERLGGGDMGVVYRAEDVTLKRMVALKFLAPSLVAATKSRELFKSEARAAATPYHHPNVCTIFDFDEFEGRPFVAMEWVQGSTLAEKIAHGALEIDEALDIVLQICKGLDAAHKQGVVHRGIKPKNIMVGKDGHVKIMDFGMAFLTKVKEFTSMSPYSAPELVLGDKADLRADIWAVGVVLYEMVAGQTPFSADQKRAVRYKILSESPDALAMVREDAPPELDRIVGNALQKDPGARYQTIDQMLADLGALRRSLSAPEVVPELLAEPASSRKLRVFLCHASDDKAAARELHRQLRDAGFDPWLDEENLLPGQPWEREIPKAVKSSDAVVVCLSKNSIGKESYVQKEIRFALDVADEKPEGTIFLIPLKLEPCTVPNRLSSWQWVELFQEKGLDRLKQALRARAQDLTRRGLLRT